jgi:hypothetical protein
MGVSMRDALSIPEGMELIEYVVEGLYAVGEGDVGNQVSTADGVEMEVEGSFMLALMVSVFGEVNSKIRMVTLTVPQSAWEAIGPKLMVGILALPSMVREAEKENEEDEKVED